MAEHTLSPPQTTGPTTPRLFLQYPGDCAALLRSRHGAGLPGADGTVDWPAELQVLTGLMLGAGEAMFVAWGPQRLLVYNDAYAQLLGDRHPAAMGAPMHSVWADVWGDIGPLVERAFAGHSLQMDDILLRLVRDGRRQECHFSFAYTPVRDGRGTVAGLYCTCRETTVATLQRRRRDEDIALQWRSFDQAPGFFGILHGPDHRYVFVNRAFQAAFGPRDFIGRTVSQVFPEAVAQGFVSMLDRVYVTGRREESHLSRFAMQRADGGEDVRIVDITFEPLFDDAGRVMGVFVLGADQSELHRLQQQEQATARLVAEAAHRSEARFRAAVQAVGVMWTNSADGRMEGLQPGWAQITGQTPAQYQGYGWADALHPEDAESTVSAWEAAVTERRPFAIEHRVRHVHGGWRRYAVRAVPVVDAEGAPREWVGVHIDVTEARYTAEALREADRRKDEFLAVLAHELRNPLAPIRSAGHVLGRAQLQAEDIAACRAIIDRQVRNMALLLDDLLDVSRIGSGTLELRKEARSLRAVVDAAVETARPLLAEKQHRLSVQLPEPDIDIEVDELRLAQVLSNLLLNAGKYTETGGRIRLTARAGPAALTIDVADNGIGIGADALEQIFEMFVAGRESPGQGGLGIGLALSRALVELHGGRLTVASDGPGRGATFSVHLPSTSLDSSAIPLDDGHAPATAPTARAGLRVLIADDNTDAAESLALLLRLEQLEVWVAADGDAALALATQERPQVAVLDIGMPLMDGHELARRLRAEPWGARMLLVAVTGWGQQQDRQQALAAGFDHHFTKPVDPFALIDCIACWGGGPG